jgi:Pregnancy-associated plasma protein-A
LTRTVNRAWASLEPETAEQLEAKTALRRGGPETLNIYLVPDAGGLLGWAYLPDGEVEHTPWDGVVVLAGSLPGGDAAPYNEGDTVTHEVGHWLSLLHTFENGCTFPGDEVVDTPYEREPAFECRIGRDTCRQLPGHDPVENFMDYSDDFCMHEFIWGQSLRMLGAWYVFRA